MTSLLVKMSDLVALTTPAAGDLLVILDISEPLDIDKVKSVAVSDLVSVPDADGLQLDLAASIAPLSGLQAAALGLGESSGAGTAKPAFYQLLFDKTTDEGREWIVQIPASFGGAPVLTGTYYMTGANSSKKFNINAQVACVSAGDASRTAKVYAATNALDVNVPDASGTEGTFTIPLVNNDSMAVGDWCNILLWNDASGGTVGQDIAITSLVLTWSH